MPGGEARSDRGDVCSAVEWFAAPNRNRQSDARLARALEEIEVLRSSEYPGGLWLGYVEACGIRKQSLPCPNQPCCGTE